MSRDRRYNPPTAARYAGSARAGTQTFWHQRITSVAGVPLTIAFIAIVIALLGRNHAYTQQILGSPLVAIVMILFIATTAYHMWIGMQEIIIDYVHGPAAKYLALFGNMFFCVVTGLASICAILKMSFGV
ncbi:MAG TPA: succinate dehydrogenase, hydrophobic membrane anchor protein [Xanthobacteraceae bacterium]|nr:succinate dehydrogenase, hydrophobic membrane anchor protein [Xanthobacteraceae bacterium]